jgi:hypothetical protein
MLSVKLLYFAYPPSQYLDVNWFVVHQLVTLGVNPRLVDENMGIAAQPGDRSSNVIINLEYLPHEGQILKFGARPLFGSENDSFRRSDA